MASIFQRGRAASSAPEKPSEDASAALPRDSIGHLRPTNDNPAEIEQKLRQTLAEIRAMTARLEKSKAAEGSMLLDPITDQEIEDYELERSRIELGIRRRQALLPVLEEAAKTSKNKEVISGLEKMLVEHEKLVADFMIFFKDVYPDLCKKMIAGFEIEKRAAEKLNQIWAVALDASFRLKIKGGPNIPLSIVSRIVGNVSGGNDVRIGDCVRLPSTDGLPVVSGGDILRGHPSQAFWWAPKRPLQPRDHPGHLEAIMGVPNPAPSLPPADVTVINSGIKTNIPPDGDARLTRGLPQS